MHTCKNIIKLIHSKKWQVNQLKNFDPENFCFKQAKPRTAIGLYLLFRLSSYSASKIMKYNLIKREISSLFNNYYCTYPFRYRKIPDFVINWENTFAFILKNKFILSNYCICTENELTKNAKITNFANTALSVTRRIAAVVFVTPNNRERAARRVHHSNLESLEN